jgi:hypothetical protein
MFNHNFTPRPSMVPAFSGCVGGCSVLEHTLLGCTRKHVNQIIELLVNSGATLPSLSSTAMVRSKYRHTLSPFEMIADHCHTLPMSCIRKLLRLPSLPSAILTKIPKAAANNRRRRENEDEIIEAANKAAIEERMAQSLSIMQQYVGIEDSSIMITRETISLMASASSRASSRAISLDQRDLVTWKLQLLPTLIWSHHLNLDSVTMLPPPTYRYDGMTDADIKACPYRIGEVVGYNMTENHPDYDDNGDLIYHPIVQSDLKQRSDSYLVIMKVIDIAGGWNGTVCLRLIRAFREYLCQDM